jgi:hypothetical protein
MRAPILLFLSIRVLDNLSHDLNTNITILASVSCMGALVKFANPGQAVILRPYASLSTLYLTIHFAPSLQKILLKTI